MKEAKNGSDEIKGRKRWKRRHKEDGPKEYRPMKRQHEVNVAGAVVGGLLVLMLCYFVYFEAIGKKSVIERPQNNRTANMENSVIRGDIITSDNVVIATSTEGEGGNQIRVYPFDNLFSNIVGYSVLRGAGLEASQQSKLLTSHVDMAQRVKNELLGIRSKGDTLVTTLDSDLQSYCYNQLGGRVGSIIVMEPKTGKLRAMVTAPNYNPNTVEEQWNELMSPDNDSGNLMNRGAQCTYPPGSTFKLLTLLEYIRENPDTWQDFHYTCTGTYVNGEYTVNCHDKHVHGEVDIYAALSQSCNGAFDTMAMSLDKDKWQELAEDFGYNKSIQDMAGEDVSLDFSFKKSSFSITEDDSTWARMQLAIGQGTTGATPLLNLMDYCAVANGGVMMKPYVIDSYVDADGNPVSQEEPQRLQRVCTEEEAALLNEFLVKVITEGTASGAASSYCQVAGKTGSAQYTSAGDYHAWFCGYAPADDPQIAVCVMLEGGGSGGEMAAPLAGNIFNYYFGKTVETD